MKFYNFLQEEDKKTVKELNSLMAQWEVTAQKLEVLETLTKKLKTQNAEIEKVFFPLAKESASKTATIRSTIVQYKTRKTTSVSYKSAFEKALGLVNAEQKAFLESFLKSVTSEGLSESIGFSNPRVQKIAEKLQNAKTEADLNAIAKEILDLEPEVTESAISSLSSKVLAIIKSVASILKGKLSNIDSAISKLKAVTNEDPKGT
jgi:ABC-type oligopeptide transport system substrate-binding subunit